MRSRSRQLDASVAKLEKIAGKGKITGYVYISPGQGTRDGVDVTLTLWLDKPTLKVDEGKWAGVSLDGAFQRLDKAFDKHNEADSGRLFTRPWVQCEGGKLVVRAEWRWSLGWGIEYEDAKGRIEAALKREGIGVER